MLSSTNLFKGLVETSPVKSLVARENFEQIIFKNFS